MAQYTRFEIYIPVVYTVTEQDPKTGKKRNVVHALADDVLRRFIAEARNKYKGITQANPLFPALFKGWWQSKPGKEVETDYLTYLFGLVRIDQSDEATELFGGWKRRFKLIAHQQEVLLIYYSVQMIGDFF